MSSVESFSVKHIEQYVGKYATCDDFLFQEQMRKTDLAIKALATEVVGKAKAESFFGNGWGQAISAAYLLEKNPSQLKISEAFRKFLIDELDQAVSKGRNVANPFADVNVKEHTKRSMMHPTHPCTYTGWKPVKIKKPVEYLNEFIQKAEVKFSLSNGKLHIKLIGMMNQTSLVNYGKQILQSY